VQLTITGPDGTIYNQNSKHGYSVIEMNTPRSGFCAYCSRMWAHGTTSVKCLPRLNSGQYFHGASQTRWESTLHPLETYYPGEDAPAYQYRYDLFRWGYLAASAILAEMRAAQGW